MPTGTGTRRRGRRGATLAEAALTLNFFFLMILGVFEFGRLMMIRHLLDNAARETVRLAVSGTDFAPPTRTTVNGDMNLTTAELEATSRHLLAGQPFARTPDVQIYRVDEDNRKIDAAWYDASAVEHEGVAVQMDVEYRPMLPTFGIVPNPIKLTAKSIMRSEGD